jgi:PleD family two-component response regulator
LNGLELCRLLKDDERTTYIPVLLVSGIGGLTTTVCWGMRRGRLPRPALQAQELIVKAARLVERHRMKKHIAKLSNKLLTSFTPAT